MKKKKNLRNTVTGYIILLYFVPLLFFSGYAAQLTSLEKSWTFLVGSIVLSACGAVFFILKMYTWESAILEEIDPLADSKAALLLRRKESVAFPPEPLAEGESSEVDEDALKQIAILQHSLTENNQWLEQVKQEAKTKEEKLEEVSRERERINYELEQLRQEMSFFQQTTAEQIEQKDMLLAEYAQTISDLRGSTDKKQQQIAKLENSLQELTYEIKNLSQLSDIDKLTDVHKSAPQPQPSAYSASNNTAPRDLKLHSSEQAIYQLKRCVNIAQKMTGASHFEFSSRFRDFSPDSFTLDQRRLFESLRSEVSSVVLVYSLKESKLIFVNNETKSLLGWSPERFIQEFPQILDTSYGSWKKCLTALRTSSEVEERFLMKTRAGQEVSVNCCLGIIPTGIFKNHVIGVLYQREAFSKRLETG